MIPTAEIVAKFEQFFDLEMFFTIFASVTCVIVLLRLMKEFEKFVNTDATEIKIRRATEDHNVTPEGLVGQEDEDEIIQSYPAPTDSENECRCKNVYESETDGDV